MEYNFPLHIDTFSEAILWYMNSKGVTRADIKETEYVEEHILSKVMRNNDGRGRTYNPSLDVISQFMLALDLSIVQKDELKYLFCDRADEIYNMCRRGEINSEELNYLLIVYGCKNLPNGYREEDSDELLEDRPDVLEKYEKAFLRRREEYYRKHNL